MGSEPDEKTGQPQALIDPAQYPQLKRLMGERLEPMTDERARECYRRNWTALDLGRMDRAELALVRRLCTQDD